MRYRNDAAIITQMWAVPQGGSLYGSAPRSTAWEMTMAAAIMPEHMLPSWPAFE